MKKYIKASAYPDGETFNQLCDYYASFDMMSLIEIYDEVYDKYNNEDLANDVMNYVADVRDGYKDDDDEWSPW